MEAVVEEMVQAVVAVAAVEAMEEVVVTGRWRVVGSGAWQAAHGAAESGATVIAVMIESPRSVLRETTRAAVFCRLLASASSAAAGAVGVRHGYSASICQPEPPSPLGGCPDTGAGTLE